MAPCVMGLYEDIRQLAEQFKKRLPVIKGEEATKQALVLPFLQTLGYDIYDPTIVQPEYIADFAKKRSGGPSEKVDYALHKGGQVAIFVECKAYGPNLDNHDPQLARYFNAVTSTKLAVITNGVHYRFFTDLTAPNVMDEKPFFVFDVMSFSERDAEHLARFSFASFSSESVQAHAQDMIFLEKVTTLVGELLRNPSEPFVRFLIDQMEVVQGRVTAKIVEKATPVVRKAIHATLIDMMTKSISEQMGPVSLVAPPPAPAPVPVSPAPPPAPAPVPPTPAPPDAVPSTSPSGVAQASAPRSQDTPTPPSAEATPKAESRVETTAEELEIFNLVSHMCGDTGLGIPVSYKDTVSYFGINLGKVTRWFIRIYTNGSKKSAIFRVNAEQASRLSARIDFEATTDGKIRVYFQQPTDFLNMRSLVALAYKLEAMRKDSEGGEESMG